MEVLFHKLGKPPYRFDQITPLLDEAASLTTNPENTSAQHQDSAIHIIESVEALAGIVEFDLSEAFPQFNIEPSEAVIEQLGPHKGSYVPPAEFELLHAIAPKTLHLKEWLFDSPELLSKNHRPEAGNAHLCRHCEWSFQRLARVPIEIDDAREFLHFQTVTSPHSNLAFIRRQLSSTEKSATSTRYRPKRLLDIGFSQDPEPKLIDGQQAEEDLNGFRYAALSYCWGSAKECQSQLKLTSETRSEFFSSIPYRSMTPVLHDAITAPLARDLLHSKWNNRGWVFQEKIISPRLLYFGARMIHFQQGNRVISEDGCPIEGDIFDSSFYVPHHYSTNLLHQLEMLQSKESIIIDFWYRLVKDFSNSNFTNVRDTFPAIAGIARSIQEFTKHQYLAGLWEEDLCCGLLWNTSREINVGKRRVDGVNPYGRIRSASISLFGPMIRIKPGSMPSVDRQGNRLWVCELFPDCLAILQPDWTPIEPHRTTGIGKRMQAQVQLLLISSCCSDQRIRSSSRDVHTPPRDDLAKLATEPATEPAHYFHTHASYGKKMTSEEMETIENEAMKPEYRNCFYEDSYDGFDTATHCDLCSDRDLRRDIWGLMTYPAGPQDTYYRVGTFFSRAEHGGSAIFKGIEPRKITLV
ncbi:HET-domain-containing protein [Diaporthe amygdali]|uniref:HET-domain-containing protein n=1 Tax=Phomopsis amygdali TaxID=1214568 RepID=UPI0022FE9BBA|nr:HET-domain-containing protein [Diaporthe amygdali]KAJ0114128.1 HET-domain-containing protein [Diaporthe amygdali]